MKLAQLDKDNYFAYTIFEDLRPIIRDICEAHKSDITTADTDTESSAGKAVRQLESALSYGGSTEEEQMRALPPLLGINYDTLTQEEFVP